MNESLLCRVPERVYLRVMARSHRDRNGCLVSDYSTNSNGYAQIGWRDEHDNRHMVGAHRAVWEFVNGALDEGNNLDHVCHNKRCIEVSHLREVSAIYNSRRGARELPEDGTCFKGHHPSWWRPASAALSKGRCQGCQGEAARRRTGHQAVVDYMKPMSENNSYSGGRNRYSYV